MTDSSSREGFVEAHRSSFLDALADELERVGNFRSTIARVGAMDRELEPDLASLDRVLELAGSMGSLMRNMASSVNRESQSKIVIDDLGSRFLDSMREISQLRHATLTTRFSILESLNKVVNIMASLAQAPDGTSSLAEATGNALGFPLRSQLDQLVSDARIEWLSAQMRTSARALDRATTKEGSNNIGHALEAYAEQQRRRGTIFQVLAIVVLVAAGGYTAVVAWENVAETSKLLQRLAVAVPVLLLSAYLAREAAQHRRKEDWAAMLVAQLSSVDAITVSMPSEVAGRVWEHFGMRVFGPPQLLGDEPKSDLDPERLAELARQVADLMRAARTS